MAQTSTVIDLARLSLSYGEGTRLDIPVRLDPIELGGQAYAPDPPSTKVRLDISRPSGGYAFRLRFPLHLDGPCMRCLDPAGLDLEVDAREVNQRDTEDEELLSPYVADDELDIGAWAHDATALAMPSQFLCRADCAGLCPVCGESLNESESHDHESAPDPRWAKLDELKSD